MSRLQHRPSVFLATLGIVLASVACGDDESSAGTTTSTTSASGGAGGTSNTSSSSGGQGGESSGSGGGGAGQGGSGGSMTVGTDGCGEALADATEQWVERSITVGGGDRSWFVWLPSGYDPNRAYPVVYQFHGCSSNPNRENNNPPVHQESGADAIVVRGRALDNCWDTSPAGPDFAYFDALVPEVEATWCADPDRRFATGYSSGSFMSHRLACERGDMLRGVATIAGGSSNNNCVGQTAALIIHDDTDMTVGIAQSVNARDYHLSNNSCDSGAATMSVAPAPCELYAGCDAGYDVVWCQTTGQNHSRQDGLSAPAFWGFLSAL